ncbi:MAG: hypothetical protein PHE17_18000 [Thiothrix sp.]|uniref:hypothetical protein n=1 Tax=Thiothrix sp. TaxID=1032 RepID=UPI0026290F3C|nr:hypothetical protein [Thiothrix sp.]MDD5394914.1 hypothetical protein [Thiothrix sp.]
MKPDNQMTIEEYRIKFPTAIPKKIWFEPQKSPTKRAEIPESALQFFADGAIDLFGWDSLRFPDALLGWMKFNAPPWIQKMFFGIVGGRLPDNLVMAQVAPGIFLSLKLEMKTQDKKGRAVGALHGRQKVFAKAEGWKIARSPDEILAVLKEFGAVVEKVKKVFDIESA